MTIKKGEEDKHSMTLYKIWAFSDMLIAQSDNDLICHYCGNSITSKHRMALFTNPNPKRITVTHSECFESKQMEIALS